MKTNGNRVIVSVCSRCNSEKVSEPLRRRVSKQLKIGLMTMSEVDFQEVRCMAACSRPIAVGISGEGKSGYLFGDIKTSEDVVGLLEFLKEYQEKQNGWTNSKERPKVLRNKIVARIPAGFL